MPTLTAHGFGDQIAFGVRVVQAGGVKLDEFHICHAAAGAPSGSNAVTRRRIRVGRVQIDFACTARGQNGVRGGKSNDFVFDLV